MTVTVLVVDDSKLARLAVCKALATLQPEWERVEAANAATAIKIAAARQIDVALIDYNMPDRNGLELAAELRSLHPGISTAIVSANHQSEVIEGTKALDAAFIRKPCSAESFEPFIADAALIISSRS